MLANRLFHPAPALRWALLVLALVPLVTSGCSTAAGPRVLEDAFVIGTSPVQLPVMAVRDAATNFDSTAANVGFFPFTFPLFAFEHAFFTLAHVVDLAVFPVHFFHDVDSLGLYDVYGFPLERGRTAHAWTDAISGAMMGAGALALPVIGVIVAVSSMAALL